METYRTRVRIFSAIVILVLGILGMRLGYLQVLEDDEYAEVSRDNAIRQIRVQPARGALYDRKGELMVDNVQTYTVTLMPRHFKEENVDLLADLLEVPDSLVRAKLDEAKAWSMFRPSPSFREVPIETFSRVQERLHELPGVGFEVGQKRRYAHEAKAAHAFGYIREVTDAELERLEDYGYRPGDLVGKAGLEKRYEPFLRGRLGQELKLVNSRGLAFTSYQNGEEDVAPFSGYNLNLTLDADLQALTESLFVNKRGGAVALDPETGEILAMVSAPDYDPAVFSQSIEPEKWKYLTTSEAKPMYNRATMMGMPPGSTWKPFMALMALQEGILTPETIYNDRGGYRLGGRVFSNHAGHVYGPIDVVDAIRVSSNAFFFNVMMNTDVNTFSRYARMFGFGERMPLEVGEQSAGLIPDSSYYDRAYPRGWTAGYSINLGIGQGDMVVTPMQMARYTAALANKGTLVPPHLVDYLEHPETGEIIRPDGPPPEEIPIEEEHFEVVREGMKQVMEAGTGYYVQLPGIPSAGKTGTSQNPHGEDHSVFILFAPYDDPEIAIAVMVENAGYGAVAAGPIASLMAEQYLTGEIADTPERQRVLQRALQARSKIQPKQESSQS